MRSVTLTASLLLILTTLSALSSAYDFVSPNPFNVREPVEEPAEEPPVYDEGFWKQQMARIQEQVAADRLLEAINKLRIRDMMSSINKPEPVAEPPVEETVEPPKPEEEVPVRQDFVGIAKTEDTLPDIEAPEVEEPIKVVIHTTPTCVTCHAYVKQAAALKNDYNIVVDSHDYSGYTNHGTWLTAFPVTEVIKGDKCVKVKVGYMSTADLKTFLESIK